MKVENQVCNLELAKKLKMLGVEQESLFYWIKTLKKNEGNRGFELALVHPTSGQDIIFFDEKDNTGGLGHYGHRLGLAKEQYSAFTVVELGELLKKAGPEATIQAYGDLHGFKGTGSIGSIGLLWLLTEPDRLAKMLIYLIENKLLNPLQNLPLPQSPKKIKRSHIIRCLPDFTVLGKAISLHQNLNPVSSNLTYKLYW